MMDPEIKVETILLTGAYKNSGVHIVRGTGIIPRKCREIFRVSDK